MLAISLGWLANKLLQLIRRGNAADQPQEANVLVGYDARSFETLAGDCPAAVAAPGSAPFALPALGWAICRVAEIAE